MKRLVRIILLLLICFISLAGEVLAAEENRTVPVISNTNVAQRTDGSKLVDIFYDLFVPDEGTVEIILILCGNGGVTYDIFPDPLLLTGDIGVGIGSGLARHIIWDAGAEEVIFDGDLYRFRILAHYLPPEDQLITELYIEENRLFLTTTEPVTIKFNYQPQNGFGSFYESYSTGTEREIILIPLPVESYGIDYLFNLQIETAETVLDTILVFTSSYHTYPLLQIDFVDVRQGDGILIRTPEGHTLAVDGGYGTYIPSFSGPAYWNGAGSPLMLNYVLSQNVTGFTYLIETHNHMDHWGGLANIRNHFDIPFDEQLSPSNTLDYAVGDYLNFDSEVSFRILNLGYPPGVSQNNENNRSIVLRVEYGDIAYLLVGDIESQVENYLLNNNFYLSADVLKVAHHGSNSSSTAGFLAAALNRNIKIAMISFGTGNPYNHPRTLERFAGFDVYGTNLPSQPWEGENYRFDVGTIRTYTDGTMIIVGYEQ